MRTLECRLRFAVEFRVLFTDYDHFAIIHACGYWNSDGTCRRPGEQVNILSRTATLDEAHLLQAYEILEHRACVTRRDLIPTYMSRECI